METYAYLISSPNPQNIIKSSAISEKKNFDGNLFVWRKRPSWRQTKGLHKSLFLLASAFVTYSLIVHILDKTQTVLLSQFFCKAKRLFLIHRSGNKSCNHERISATELYGRVPWIVQQGLISEFFGLCFVTRFHSFVSVTEMIPGWVSPRYLRCFFLFN